MEDAQGIRQHVKDKKRELIYALSEQEYSYAEIAYIFGIPRSSAHYIVSRKPAGYKSKWVKRDDID